jgi:hypothetical protein
VYLSNAEKETLFLTGYGDVPPWAVQQGLEQALARGTYVPGHESLAVRLAEQLDLEERLATAGGKTTEQQQAESDGMEGVAEQLDWEDKETIGEEEQRLLVVQRWMERGPLDAMQRMYADQVYASLTRLHQTSLGRLSEMATEWGQGIDEETNDAAATVDWDAALEEHRVYLATEWPSLALGGAATEEATTEHQEPPGEPPVDEWRSPLEIVQEGASEGELQGPGEEPVAPAATEQEIEDQDFTRFTKAQLVSFAMDNFGMSLNRWDSKDQLIAQVQQLVDEANG